MAVGARAGIEFIRIVEERRGPEEGVFQQEEFVEELERIAGHHVLAPLHAGHAG